jgi:hypothetical protein
MVISGINGSGRLGLRDGLDDGRRRPRAPLAVMDRVTAAFFFGLGRLRSGRGFHPRGASFSARITALPGVDAPWGRHLLWSGGERQALVRFSKGAGLPDPLPDVLGLAVRIIADESAETTDLLLSSAPPWPLARHILRPAKHFSHTSFSSVLPFECEGAKLILGAVPARRAARYTLRELRRTEAPELAFFLTGARPRQPWEVFAKLDIVEKLEPGSSERLRFDPFNVPSGLRPVGGLNRLRMPAYRASQRGRGGD